MSVQWSEVQYRRLVELNADESDLNIECESAEVRDRTYQAIESRLVKRERQRLNEFREIRLRPQLIRLENRLTDVLVQNGFVQVITPIIMSKGLLSKMGIGDSHPLTSQIYWLGRNKCLRPMLAPHLYFILKDLMRLWEKPVRIFEVGPCFRKESQGARHSSEFTMLNLVEMGLPQESCQDRIRELAGLVAEAAGIKDYNLEAEKSEVYGETLDVVSANGNVELGSGAIGPHPLDRHWKITDAWVGIGFGLERLLMAAGKGRSLAKMGRSLTYLDGIRLNLQ
ncbi:MAG: pyrrolysine--tRNA(Pyl) ligase large subunit [Deltaproteobacteria bacterium]|nr:MAG: pyrrolysine--tRNA(Pyl) ligase large subunit [Deltaproteobacteria bacterium]